MPRPFVKVHVTLLDADRDNVVLEARCVFCTHVEQIRVPGDAAIRWGKGELAQNVFPMLETPVRELLISGTCPKCWDRMFSEDE